MAALSPTPALEASPPATVLRMVAFVACYLGLAWISYVYPMRGLNITPWNPQAALAAGLLVVHPAAWPVVWVAVAAAEAVVGSEQMPFPALVVSTGALTAGYAVTAAGLRRWLGPDLTLIGRRSVVLFLLLACGGALIASVLRAGALWAVGVVPFGRIPAVVHRASIGDGVGFIVTLPVLLVLASPLHRARTKAMLRAGETWVIAVVAVIGIVAVFQQPAPEQFKYFYILFLPVVWASVRYGAVGAVWSAALVQGLLIGALQAGQYPPLTVFELQVLIAALTATGILLGAIVDERQAAEEALRSSLRLAAAGDMAAALAHELNQPLTAISTYARASQMMARGLGEPHAGVLPLVEVADKLAVEATRAGEVVNRLRRFFRDRSTDLQATDLSELLAEAVHSQARRADELGVRLAHTGEHGLAHVWVDRVQIAVVLRNLLANALEAASQAQAPAGAERSVVLSAERHGSEVVVTVLDSAPGLGTEEVRSVFESRSSGKPGGMGIGLAISRSIVEAHGGRLWAEPGPGGRFRFSLPTGWGASHD